MTKLNVELFIQAALDHGMNSEADHEAGDLQDYIREAWGCMDFDQRKVFCQHPAVVSFIEASLGGATPAQTARVAKEVITGKGIEKLLKLAQTHGNNEGADVEITDLQDMLRASWSVMSDDQKRDFFEDPDVQDTYENATTKNEIFLRIRTFRIRMRMRRCEALKRTSQAPRWQPRASVKPVEARLCRAIARQRFNIERIHRAASLSHPLP